MPQTPPAHPDGQGLLSPSPASGARYLPTIPDTEGQEASPAEGAPAPATHEAETLQNLLREWLNIPDWTTSQVYLQEHPRLLGKQAEQVLEQLHQVPSEGEARELPSTRQALLHDARVWGIPGVCTYYQLAEQVATINAPERELLLQQVQEWLDTPTWEQSQVYLDAHPDLFTSAAEVLLAWLWQVEQTDAARVLLAQHLQLLQRAHIEGSAVAYRELPHPETLNDAATEAMRQYLASGNLADLDNALARWQQALMLISPVDSDRSDLLNLLGLGLHNRYERTGALADLEAAINAYQQAVDLTPPGTPDRPALLHLLGLGLHNHYEHTGALDDLQAAINAYQQAVDLTPPGTPDPALLNMLGSVLHDHYERTGALDDLEAAISVFQQAVDLTPVDSSDRPALLNNLGNELRVRFSRTGEMADLQAAIEACQQAVDLTPVDSSDRPAHLTGLGNGLRARFTRTGALGDLEAAIEAYQQAVDLTPADSSDRPALLNNLGLGLGDRFTRTGGMADLEAAIEAYQQAVDLTPADTPDPVLLNNLGCGLYDRFTRTGALADLEAAISASQQAVDLTPLDAPDRPALLNNLGSVLHARFTHVGALADLEAAINASQQAVDLTPLDAPDRLALLNNLGCGLHARFTHVGALDDLQAAINAFQQAVDLTPADASVRPALLNNLGSGLHDRYARTGALADLEAALAAWEASWAARYSRFISLPVVYQLGQQRQGRDLAATLVTTSLELAARSHSRRQSARRHAFEVAEASKSRLLTQLVGRGPLPMPPGLSLQAADREYRLLSDLTVLDTQDLASHNGLVANLNRLQGPDRLQQRHLLVQELDQLWVSIAQLGVEGANYVALRRGDSPTWKSLARWARELGRATALLSLFSTADQLLLFLLRPNWRQPRVIEAPLNQASWENLRDRFFHEVNCYIPGLRRGETWDQPLRLLLDQAQRHLAGVERLILAPVEFGHLLPWGVLAERAGWRTPTGQSLPLVTLPALGVLPRLRRRPHRSTGPALVVGNPLGDLPHAEVEAMKVAERFGVLPLLGATATKKAVLASLEGAGLIHLATHALFNPEDPLESGIILAAEEILTAREVLQHRLQADLLVLSACESGQVGFLGGEELAGLSQAFLQAGVRSLLVSLWRVNDPATAALMEAFYSARKTGADKALALRQAMTQIQQDPRWTHPYYWGAFILVGDWD